MIVLRLKLQARIHFKINVPEKYRVTHEEHFGQVTAKYP